MQATAEQKLDYVLNILKNCTEIKPDYHKAATDTGCKNANKAQIKFKKIIEEKGKFMLVNGKIVGVGDGNGDGNGDDGHQIPDTPKPKAKKRGRAKKSDANDDDDAAPPASKKKKVVSVDISKEK